MSRKSWIGVFLIILGIGFVLQQAGLWQFTNIFATGWPIILIIIGIIQLLNRNRTSSVSGLMFIAAGGLLFLNQFVEFNIYQYTWPIILIFSGLVFIFSKSVSKRKKPVNTEDFLDVLVIFSGSETEPQSDRFTDGTATAIFGGAKIDLRGAIVPQEGAVLELTAVFGGIDIRIPDNVRVDISGTPLFGGWENKTKRHVENRETTPILKIDCTTIFGGVTIRD